jgi:Icc-related predicted phosphoesterase/uncharacterized protein YprB with RNaseH-like and TPR domain
LDTKDPVQRKKLVGSLLSELSREELVSICDATGLPKTGAKNELETRIVASLEWDGLIIALLGSLHWWQLLFLRPIIDGATSKKGILEHVLVVETFRMIRRTFRTDPEYFLNRKMKFLLRSGFVIKRRHGLRQEYNVNPELEPHIRPILSGLEAKDIVEKYGKSTEYAFYLKYARPGASIKGTEVSLEAGPPQYSDPNAKLTRLVAFSDYRIQDLDLLVDFVKALDPKPDLILYSGDDVTRFGPFPDAAVRRILASSNPKIGSLEKIDGPTYSGGPALYSFAFRGAYREPEVVAEMLARRIWENAKVQAYLEENLVIPRKHAKGVDWVSGELKRCLKDAGVPDAKLSFGGTASYFWVRVESKEFRGTLSLVSLGKDRDSAVRFSSDWLVFALRHLQGVDLTNNEEVVRTLRSDLRIVVEDGHNGTTKGIVAAGMNARNVFEELASCSHYGLCAVIGNDDHGSARELIVGDKVYDVHRAPVILGDHAVIGQEGAPIRPGEMNPGLLLYEEDEISQHLSSFEKFVTGKRPILVSHPPPHLILDHALRFGEGNIGSESVMEFLRKYPNTTLLVCGHVHYCGGKSERTPSGTLVLNAASHDNPGEPGKVAVIDIDSNGELHTEWHLLHELTGVFGIGPRIAEKLRASGVRRVEDLASKEDGLVIEGLSPSLLAKLSIHARAIFEGKPYVLSELQIGKEPAVYLDIETDLTQSLVWLVGVYSDRTRKKGSFFADDQDDEAKILKQLLKFLDEEGHNDPIYYYSCNNFDKRVLEARFDVHRIKRDFTDRMIDLCPTVRNTVAMPLKSYRLKDLARYFGYEYKHPNLDGFDVAIKYQAEYLPHKDPKVSSVLKEYNMDDVLFLPDLISKVRSITDSKPPTV